MYTDPAARAPVANSGATVAEIEALGITSTAWSIWNTNATGYIEMNPPVFDPLYDLKAPDQTLTQSLEYEAYNDLYLNILRRGTIAPFYVQDFENIFEVGELTMIHGAMLLEDSTKSRSGGASLQLRSDESGYPTVTTPSFDSSNFHHVIVELWFYVSGSTTIGPLLVQCVSSVNGMTTTIEGSPAVSWSLGNDYNFLEEYLYVVAECKLDGVDEAAVQIRYESMDVQTSAIVDDIFITGLEPTPVPTPSPSEPPTALAVPTSNPSRSPSSRPTEILTREEICPVNRTYPLEKFLINEFPDALAGDGVEDDLSEISSLVFTSLTDAENNLYAYVVSDKNQFSLKVIKFTRTDPATGEYLTGTATTVAAYTLNVAFDRDDWEDISLGPCMDDGNTDGVCIYIGNFGNNNRNDYEQRTTLEIFKFPEPDFPPVDRTLDVATISFDYINTFDNPTRKFDAEAMFVDWTGAFGVGKGDIYVVTKGKCGEGVGRIPADLHRNIAYDGTGTTNVGSIQQVMFDPPWQGTQSCSATSKRFLEWQGADMSRDGRTIAMIVGASPSRVYFFPRETGQTVEAALSGPSPSIVEGKNLGGPGASCDYIAATSYGLTDEKKWEAVAFIDFHGTKYAEVSECNGGGNCKVPVYMHQLLLENVVDESPSDNGWEEITFDDFNDATFGNYLNGVTEPGSALHPSRICGGGFSVELRQDNAESSSIFHAVDQDCSAYPWLRATFTFRPFKWEHMDTLFLEISLDGGVNYYIVGDWSMEVGGIVEVSTSEQVCYTETVSLKATDFGGRANFGPNVRLRLRASSDSMDDFVYIDNVLFEGHEAPIVL